MVEYTRHRFRKNVPGPFYTTGDCLACEAPEEEAPDLLAPLIGDNGDTYFVRQPTTPAEVERACRALEVCCVAALRYGGTDQNIIRRLGNDPEYCDRLLPGERIPRPKWILRPSPAIEINNAMTQTDQTINEQEPASANPRRNRWYDGFSLVEETRTDGWCYGAITEFNEPECHPDGCESGDGYVETPDGSRIGLAWSTGNFAGTWDRAGDQGMGVFEVAFPKPVKNLDDLVECFRTVLPEIQALYASLR